MKPGQRFLFLVLALVFLTAFIWGLVVLTREVKLGHTQKTDEQIMIALRSPEHVDDPLGGLWVEHLARDLTSLGSTYVIILVTLATGGFLAFNNHRRSAVLLLTATASGMVVYYVFKQAIGRPRPELVSHLVHSETPSYPSGHAMLAGLLFFGLALIAGKELASIRLKLYLICVAVLLALAVGASRIYLGVHWATDVLAGWLAGFGWALLWWLIWWIGDFRRSRGDTLAGMPAAWPSDGLPARKHDQNAIGQTVSSVESVIASD